MSWESSFPSRRKPGPCEAIGIFAADIAVAGYQHSALALLSLTVRQLQVVIGFGPVYLSGSRKEIPRLMGKEGNVSLRSWCKKMACFKLLKGLEFRRSPGGCISLGRGQVRSSMKICICFRSLGSWWINDVSCEEKMNSLSARASWFGIWSKCSLYTTLNTRTRKHPNKVLSSGAF